MRLDANVLHWTFILLYVPFRKDKNRGHVLLEQMCVFDLALHGRMLLFMMYLLKCRCLHLPYPLCRQEGSLAAMRCVSPSAQTPFVDQLIAGG